MARDHRRAGAAVAVVGVLAVGLGALALREQDDARAAGDVMWRELPAGPLAARAEAVGVWAGDRFLVWGGTPVADSGEEALGAEGGSGEALADGAAFDPGSREWRAFDSASPAGRVAAGGVWTGSSLVVWGGSTTTGPLTFDTTALVYDPDAGTWRQTEPAPIVGRTRPQLVWTGREVVVVGGSAALLAGDPAVAALDPATGAWRTVGTLPDWLGQVAAVAWTGEAIAVIGGERDRPGVLLDPGTGASSELPPLPAGGPEPIASVALVDDGTLVLAGVVMGPDGDRIVAATLRPGADEWEAHPDDRAPGLPFDEAIRPAAAVVGDHVVVWGAWWHRAAVFDLSAGRWSADPGPDLVQRAEFAWAAGDGRLYLWGGESTSYENGPSAEVLDDGAVAAGA